MHDARTGSELIARHLELTTIRAHRRDRRRRERRVELGGMAALEGIDRRRRDRRRGGTIRAAREV